MTPSERLMARLRAMGVDIPEGSTLQRTYAGYWQRKGGAWSWFLLSPDGRDFLGSYFPVKTLLRTRLNVTQGHRHEGTFSVFPWKESTARERAHFHLWIDEP